MNEKEWVEKWLSGRTRGWDDLVINRVSLESCPEPLKTKLELFRKVFSEIENYLKSLGYEAG